jgi:hypothetical protein
LNTSKISGDVIDTVYSSWLDNPAVKNGKKESIYLMNEPSTAVLKAPTVKNASSSKVDDFEALLIIVRSSCMMPSASGTISALSFLIML